MESGSCGSTATGGSVAISSAQQSDVAAALQLGVANGGIEITRWSRARPAPTGIVGRLNNGADDLGRLHTFAIARPECDRRLAADRSRGRGDSHGLSRAPVCRASGATDVCRNQLCSGGGRQHARLLPQCASAPRRDRCFHLEQYKTARLDEQPLLGAACRAYGLRLCRASRDRMPASIRCSAAPVRRISAPGRDVRFRRAGAAYNVRAYTVGQTGGVVGAGAFQGNSVAGTNGDAPSLQTIRRAFR